MGEEYGHSWRACWGRCKKVVDAILTSNFSVSVARVFVDECIM